MNISFSKYEGLGNDFIIVDHSAQLQETLTPAWVTCLCDRHRGIGGDGLIFVSTESPRPRMKLINQDGSPAQMSGNGLRCVVAHLFRKDVAQIKKPIVIDTDAGPHTCTVLEGDGGRVMITVRMQVPELRASKVPFLGADPDAEIIDKPLEVDGKHIHLTLVSMGNPHAVTFDAVLDAVDDLGPRIERDPRFPERVNVEFARITGPHSMDLIVWERGAGFTQACGTGACAATVAAVETGRLPRHQPVCVTLPGGEIHIKVAERNESVEMTGPAHHVFDGQTRAGK